MLQKLEQQIDLEKQASANLKTEAEKRLNILSQEQTALDEQIKKLETITELYKKYGSADERDADGDIIIDEGGDVLNARTQSLERLRIQAKLVSEEFHNISERLVTLNNINDKNKNNKFLTQYNDAIGTLEENLKRALVQKEAFLEGGEDALHNVQVIQEIDNKYQTLFDNLGDGAKDARQRIIDVSLATSDALSQIDKAQEKIRQSAQEQRNLEAGKQKISQIQEEIALLKQHGQNEKILLRVQAQAQAQRVLGIKKINEATQIQQQAVTELTNSIIELEEVQNQTQTDTKTQEQITNLNLQIKLQKEKNIAIKEGGEALNRYYKKEAVYNALQEAGLVTTQGLNKERKEEINLITKRTALLFDLQQKEPKNGTQNQENLMKILSNLSFKKENNLLTQTGQAITSAQKWRAETLKGLDQTKAGYQDFASEVEQIFQGRIRKAFEDHIRSSHDWRAGVIRGFNDVVSSSRDMATQMENAIEGAFSNLEDVLVDLLKMVNLILKTQ